MPKQCRYMYRNRLSFAAGEAGCPLDHCPANYHIIKEGKKYVHVDDGSECRCDDKQHKEHYT